MGNLNIRDLLTRARALWMPLAIGFFLIIYAALGVVYFQQQQEQNRLRAQIAQQGNIVLLQQRRISDFPADIARAQSELDAARGAFPTAALTEIDIFEAILALAQEKGVEINLRPLSIKEEKVGKFTYRVLPFTLDISGGYSQVADFIAELDSGQTLKTVVLKDLTFSPGGDETTATMNFSVYALRAGE